MILAITVNGCFVMAEEGEGTTDSSETSENHYEPKKGYINSSMVTVRLQPSTSGGYLEDENYGPHYEYKQEVTIINEAYDDNDNLWYEVTFTVNDKEYDTWEIGRASCRERV